MAIADLNSIERADSLDVYVPSIATSWISTTPSDTWRRIDGTLVFADISGFTALSERLARQGRIGAEELTTVLDRVFGAMLEVVYERGGALLKFGGDALLLLFATDDHAIQACAAAVEMRSALREAWTPIGSTGRIRLHMSSGIHSGPVDLFLVGDSHRELIITGPASSVTTEMEGIAQAGEIVVSDQTRALLPNSFTGQRKGEGWLLAKRVIHHPGCGRTRPGSPSNDLVSTLIPLALRNHLSTGVGDSEHRIATVCFLQFNGVDQLLAAAGPERVGEDLDALVREVQIAADAEGVCFLASDIDADGGKIILATGVPSSQHDDEGRMLRSARQILDADLTLGLRMGVNRGHVFSGDVGTTFRRTFTVMGDAVNVAARVMTAAAPGMLYATAPVLERSATLFRTETLAPFPVKGKQQPVQAYSVIEEIGVRPPELEDDLPFHGREAELEQIVGRVNSCSWSGTGGMMTISGATGTGKSRLIAEALKRCPGMDTMVIQAEPNGSQNPYWAFRDPIRRLLGIVRSPQAQMIEELEREIEARTPQLLPSVPLLGEVMHITVPDNEVTAAIDPRFRPDRTADVVIELMAGCCPRPLAIVAEDGQWLDDASLRLLRRLGEAASSRPWTVIVTARREVHGHENLGDEVVLRSLDDDVIRVIAIEATSAAPLRPHELDSVVAKADGNPLVLSELLRVIRDTGNAEHLPESIGALVSTQIDTLHPLTRQVLRYASVLGRSFPRIVLEQFLAPEQVQLDDATSRELSGFIGSDGDDRFRFRHSVVHEAAYEGLSYRKRRELHARAGDVIERLAGDDPDTNAEALATHYSQAGKHEKAWRFSRIAGDKAKHTFSNAEAAEHYRRAIDSARWLEVGEDERAKVHELLGDVLDRLGDFDRALSAYRKAQHLYPDGGQQARVLFVQGRMLHKLGELSRALRTLTRGLKLASATGSNHVAVDILAQKASIRQYQGRYPEALALAKTAVEQSGPVAKSVEVAVALMVCDWAMTALGLPTDYSATRRALDISRSLGDLHTEAAMLNNLGMFDYYKGNWDAAADYYARSSDAFRKTGDDIAAAYGQANIAEILAGQGHLEEGESLFSSVLPVFRAAGDLPMFAFVLTQLARIRVQRADIESALWHLDEALDVYNSIGASTERVEVLLRRAEALLITRRIEEARSLLESRRELVPARVPAQLKSLAHRVLGVAEWTAGEHDLGRSHLQASLDAARALSADVDELAALHTLAAFGAIGSDEINRAVELCEKLGVVSVPLFYNRLTASLTRTHSPPDR